MLCKIMMALDMAGLGFMVIKLVLSLYLISSVLTKYDARSLRAVACAVRIILAIGILLGYRLNIAAFILAIGLIMFHRQSKRHGLSSA